MPTQGVDQLTLSEYYDFDSKAKTNRIANAINVNSAEYVIGTEREDIFTDDTVFEITEGSSLSLTLNWSNKPVMPDSVEITISGFVTLLSTINYIWGSEIEVQGSIGSQFRVGATGLLIERQNVNTYTAQDSESVKEYGVLKYDFPDNQLVQSIPIANTIADSLLSNYKSLRKDANLDWPGNLITELGDPVLITEYNDGIINTESYFFITKNEIEFTGALDFNTEVRRFSD